MSAGGLVMVRSAGLGAAAGLAWGLAARGFMRLLAEYPEFSWSGTLAIVGVAAVIGGLVGLVRSARLSGRSRWWRLLGLPFLLLFAGPGAVLFPGVVGVVMLLDRRRLLALPGVALVGASLWFCATSLGGAVTGRQVLGLVVLAGCLGVLGWAARELVRRWLPGVRRGPGRPLSGSRGVEPDGARGTAASGEGPSRSFAPYA